MHAHEGVTMTDGKVLEFTGVTKTFDGIAAVSDFTARVDPGFVTAFLGPNGAGKTTTLRILLGQLRATSGTATIGGRAFSQLSSARRTVGWVAETPVFRPRRTAVKHLSIVARQAGVPSSRVGEVLDLVGLSDVADIRISGYSLGMTQRLAVAEALLGDPGVLVLDEPANGLDPEGIRWIRLLIRRLADEGRTVLVSSHILSEIQQVADRLLVISNGSLVFAGAIEDLEDASSQSVAVDSPDRAGLSRALREKGYSFELLRSGINVHGTTSAEIGALAADAGIALTTLQQRNPSLEDVFLKLVSGEYIPPMTAAIDPHASEPADTAHGTEGSVSHDEVAPQEDSAPTSDAAPEQTDATTQDAPADTQDAPAERDGEDAADEVLRATAADVALASAGPGVTAAAGASLAAAAIAESVAEAQTADDDEPAVPEDAENEAPDEHGDEEAQEVAAPEQDDEAGPASDERPVDAEHGDDTLDQADTTHAEEPADDAGDATEPEPADEPTEAFTADEWTIDGAAARPATTGTEAHSDTAPHAEADNADTFDVLEEADVVEYDETADETGTAQGSGLPGSASLANLLAGEDEEVGGAAAFLAGLRDDNADAPSDQTAILPVVPDDDATVALPTVVEEPDEDGAAAEQAADEDQPTDDDFTFDDLLRGTGADATDASEDEG